MNFQFSFLCTRTKGAPVASVLWVLGVWIFFFAFLLLFFVLHRTLGIGRDLERSSNPVPLLERGILVEQRKLNSWDGTLQFLNSAVLKT